MALRRSGVRTPYSPLHSLSNRSAAKRADFSGSGGVGILPILPKHYPYFHKLDRSFILPPDRQGAFHSPKKIIAGLQPARRSPLFGKTLETGDETEAGRTSPHVILIWRFRDATGNRKQARSLEGLLSPPYVAHVNCMTSLAWT